MISFQDFLKELGFDLNKYSVFKSADDFEIIKQLRIRERVFNKIRGFTVEDKNYFMAYVVGDKLSHLDGEPKEVIDKIASTHEFKKAIEALVKLSFYELRRHYCSCFDNPIIDDDTVVFSSDSIEMKDVYSGCLPFMMSYSDVVKPLSRYSLEGFVFGCALKGAGEGRPVMLTQQEIEEMDEEDNNKLFLISNESINMITPPSNHDDLRHNMYAAFDLSKSDDDIISSFRKLLPIWRNELQIDADGKKRSWEYVRGKIISYKIFPLIDLLDLTKIYTHVTKKRVPKKIIAAMIYPDGERDGFGLDQTVMPFLEKIIGKSSKLQSDYKIYKKN